MESHVCMGFNLNCWGYVHNNKFTVNAENVGNIIVFGDNEGSDRNSLVEKGSFKDESSFQPVDRFLMEQ